MAPSVSNILSQHVTANGGGLLGSPKEQKVTLESYLSTAKSHQRFYLPLPIGLIRPTLPPVGLRTIMGLTL